MNPTQFIFSHVYLLGCVFLSCVIFFLPQLCYIFLPHQTMLGLGLVNPTQFFFTCIFASVFFSAVLYFFYLVCVIFFLPHQTMLGLGSVNPTQFFTCIFASVFFSAVNLVHINNYNLVCKHKPNRKKGGGLVVYLA